VPVREGGKDDAECVNDVRLRVYAREAVFGYSASPDTASRVYNESVHIHKEKDRQSAVFVIEIFSVYRVVTEVRPPVR
jgi:hypothetical protein